MEMPQTARTGPLAGLRILEFAALGPAPFGCMLLADLGASVVTIERKAGGPGRFDILKRNRTILPLDLKSEADRQAVLQLARHADAVVEGFRPGVMERLGLGPDRLRAENERLVYGRMTGWGQQGPLAKKAGHDLNFLAISGALSLFERDGRLPAAIPPLVGDMGGGGAFLAFGLLAAIFDARRTGVGQVVDAAIVDGSATLYALIKGLSQAGRHAASMGENMLDGGRYFYRTYRCSDGRYVAVGAIEPQLRAAFLAALDLTEMPLFTEDRPEREKDRISLIAQRFATQPRDHWTAVFEPFDACVTPVLSMQEAEDFPANRQRDLFQRIDGVVQPAPSPRFEKSPVSGESCARASAGEIDKILADWGRS